MAMLIKDLHGEKDKHQTQDVVRSIETLPRKERPYYSREQELKDAKLSAPLSNVIVSKTFGTINHNRPVVSYRDNIVQHSEAVNGETVSHSSGTDEDDRVTKVTPPEKAGLFQNQCDDPRLVAWLEAHYPLGGKARRNNVWRIARKNGKRIRARKLHAKRIQKGVERDLAMQAVKAGYGTYRGPKLEPGYRTPSCPFVQDRVNGESYVLRWLFEGVTNRHWRYSMESYRSVYRDEYYERYGDKNMSQPYEHECLEWQMRAEQQKTMLIEESDPQYGMVGDPAFEEDVFADYEQAVAANDTRYPTQGDFLPWDKKCEDPETGLSLMPDQFAGGPLNGREWSPLILGKAVMSLQQYYATLQDLSARGAEASAAAYDSKIFAEKVEKWRAAARRLHVRNCVKSVIREAWPMQNLYGFRPSPVGKGFTCHYPFWKRSELEECIESCRKASEHKNSLLNEALWDDNWKEALRFGTSRAYHHDRVGEELNKTLAEYSVSDLGDSGLNDAVLHARSEDIDESLTIITSLDYGPLREIADETHRVYAEMAEELPEFCGPPKPPWLKTNQSVICDPQPQIITSDNPGFFDNIPAYALGRRYWSLSYGHKHIPRENCDVEGILEYPLIVQAMEKCKRLLKGRHERQRRKPATPVVPFQWQVITYKGETIGIPMVHIL